MMRQMTRYYVLLGLIMLLAGLVRLPFVRSGTVEADLALMGDESNYVFSAVAMLDGRLAEQDRVLPWMRAPLAPLVMADAALLSRSSPAWTIAPAIAVNLGLALAMVGLVAAIARLLAGPQVALLAALGLALLPAWIFYPQWVLSETIYTTLLLWMLWFVLRTPPGYAMRHWLAIGALLGLTALCRSSALTLVPLAWLAVAWQTRRWRPALAGAAAITLALGAVLAPWVLRNALVHGGLIVVDTTGAYNLWQDNTPLDRATVKATILELPGPAERQAYASAAFRRDLLADPGRFASAALQRVGRALLPERITESRNDWLRLYPNRAVAWAELYAFGNLLSQLLLLPLALFGSALLWRRGRRDVGLLVAGLTAHYLFQSMLIHYSPRFFAPLLPVYLIPATVALTAGRAGWRWLGRSWRGWVVVAATAGFWLASWPYSDTTVALLRADWHWWRGASCAAPADLDRLRTAARLMPSPNWRLTTALGRCEAAQGDPQVASATLRTAVVQAQTIDLTGADAQAGLIALYRPQGDREQLAQLQQIAPNGQLALLDWAWADLPPPAARLDVGGLDAGYLRGFYGPETAPDQRTYRWMSAAGTLRFPGCTPGLYQLTLVLASGHPPEESSPQLRIGRELALELRPEWRRIITMAQLDQRCELELAATAWRPRAYDPAMSDPRLLGFMLDWAAIAPLP
jgi:hypothetical protein